LQNREAKDKRIRLWKDYTPPTSNVNIKDKNYTAKVIEVINADGMIVKLADGSERKIFLSSIRFPRFV
jgi:staphylococcal nuclease domain-containing protein 1